MKPDLDIQIWYPDDFPNRPHQHNRLANRILAAVCLGVIALAAAIRAGAV
jgi:hypothetical protein